MTLMKFPLVTISAVLVCFLSGCLPMYYGTSVSPGEIVSGKSREEIAKSIGRPIQTRRFSPPVRLGDIPEFRRNPEPEKSRIRVRWKDEYLCRKNIRRETGGQGTLSDRDMIYINTLGMSELVAAPVIAGRDFVGQFENHRILVWSDLDGTAVFYTFDGD